METRTLEPVPVTRVEGVSWRERAQQLNDRGVALTQQYNVLVQAAASTRAELDRVRAELAAAKASPLRWALRRLLLRRSA